MNTFKVFCIGMFKTGTKSLGCALDHLGYKTLHGPWWDRTKIIIDNDYEHPEEWPKYYNNVKNMIEQYDAFEDYPWMFLYREIETWYPRSKFILTIRNERKVAINSMNMCFNNGGRDLKSMQFYIDRYTKHRNDVLKYFHNKRNLLIVSWENKDGWIQLCRFLNKPIPKIPFPHINKGEYSKEFMNKIRGT